MSFASIQFIRLSSFVPSVSGTFEIIRFNKPSFGDEHIQGFSELARMAMQLIYERKNVQFD